MSSFAPRFTEDEINEIVRFLLILVELELISPHTKWTLLGPLYTSSISDSKGITYVNKVDRLLGVKYGTST